MKHKHLTWYLLVDGTHADPNDVSPGDDGVLRHKDGLAVALHEDGTPQSIGVDAVDNMNVEAAIIEDAPADKPREEAPVPETPVVEPEPEQPAAKPTPTKAKDVKPETAKRGYKTRESKAR